MDVHLLWQLQPACPLPAPLPQLQFTDTALVRSMQQDPALAAEVMADMHGRLLSVDMVTQAGMALLTDNTKVGTCLVVLVDGSWVEPQRTRFKSGAADTCAALPVPSAVLRCRSYAQPLPV